MESNEKLIAWALYNSCPHCEKPTDLVRITAVKDEARAWRYSGKHVKSLYEQERLTDETWTREDFDQHLPELTALRDGK